MEHEETYEEVLQALDVLVHAPYSVLHQGACAAITSILRATLAAVIVSGELRPEMVEIFKAIQAFGQCVGFDWQDRGARS